ncbi:hypothetical protein D3C81_1820850 [compost metagenome]
MIEQVYTERSGQYRLKHEDIKEDNDRSKPWGIKEMLYGTDKMPLQPENERGIVRSQMHPLLNLQLIFIQGEHTEHSHNQQHEFIGTQKLSSDFQ